MAKVVFTPNIQRHVACPQAQAPGATVREVLKAWKQEINHGSRFFVPQAFSDYRPLLISDPHHPFILARLAAEIDYRCEEVSGMRPLFHAVRDETLVSLLPKCRRCRCG